MKTTLLGGVLFLAPVAVLILLLGKIFEFSVAAARPIESVIPVKTVAGIAAVQVVAVLLILLICYLAGHIARRAFLRSRLEFVDGVLIDVIPSYAAFKATLGSAATGDREGGMLKPVVVHFDDYRQIGFEVEADGREVAVFLPGSPGVWTGETVIVDADRVEALDLPTWRVVRLMRGFGRGSLAARAEAQQVTGG